MTYLQFHLVFTIPLFFFVLFLNRKNSFALSQRSLAGMGTLVLLALSYTTPWDSYLIQQKIWSYAPENVIGTLYFIPFEEYFFFIIQTVISCLTLAYLLRRRRKEPLAKMTIRPWNLVMLLVSWAFTIYFASQASYTGPFEYLNLVWVWSVPILLLQLSLGLSILIDHWKIYFLAVIPLTLYFWIADSIAIAKRIWFFPAESISGIEIAGYLPIEEALFFLVTNMMVTQGYILFTRVDLSQIRLQGVRE